MISNFSPPFFVLLAFYASFLAVFSGSLLPEDGDASDRSAAANKFIAVSNNEEERGECRFFLEPISYISYMYYTVHTFSSTIICAMCGRKCNANVF